MDSGCSNHMSGERSLFKGLDESKKSEVRLGDDKLMKVQGKGTIAIKTTNGNTKTLHDVQYVPNLAHNLLSVGQLLESGYKIEFDDSCCSVYEKKSGQSLVSVYMSHNRMLPLQVANVENYSLVAKSSESKLWHLRYGHLNVKGLKLLVQNS